MTTYIPSSICTIYVRFNTKKLNIHGKPTPYVGQTWDTIEDRAGKNGYNYQQCKKFWNAIQKYGWEAFTSIELAKATTQDEGDYLENLFQDVYDSIKNGYNLRGAGSRGKHSPETIAKMSIAQSGPNNPMFGKPAPNKGISPSQGTKDLMSKNHNPNNIPPSRTGTTLTQEHKDKIANGVKKAGFNLTNTQIRAIQADTRVYTVLAKEYGISVSSVHNYKHLPQYKV